MGKPFKLGLILGRFQGLHSGHVEMIKVGLVTCDKLLLLVGSSQEALTERNPFNLKIRMDIIKLAFPDEIKEGKLLLGHIDDMTNEDDHSLEWGDFVLNKVDMWSQHYGLDNDLDVMIFGNDEERLSWYRPELVSKVNQIILSRSVNTISATTLREYLWKNEYFKWSKHVPYGIESRGWFDYLKENLLEVPYYKEIRESWLDSHE